METTISKFKGCGQDAAETVQEFGQDWAGTDVRTANKTANQNTDAEVGEPKAAKAFELPRQ